MQPFLLGGHEQIIYLCSALDLPVTPEESLSDIDQTELGHRMHQQLEQARKDGTLGFSDKVAHLLLTYASARYNNFLADHLSYLGQSSTVWTTAFGEYSHALIKGIKLRLQQNEGQFRGQDLEILKHLPEKLHALLKGGVFVPNIVGQVPLLCPEYMKGMMDMLMVIEKHLSLVSGLQFLLSKHLLKEVLQVVSWFVPGLLDHHKLRQGKSTSDQPISFHSETEGLLHSLFYFQHMKSNKVDWAHTQPSLMAGMTMQGQTMSNEAIITKAWHQIISLVLKTRNITLLPFTEEIHKALDSKVSDVSENENILLNNSLEPFKTFITNWINVSFKDEKKTSAGFLKVQQSVRHMQVAPPLIREAISKLDSPPLSFVYQGLCWGTFNWFTCLKGNNNMPMRNRVIKHLLEESRHHQEHRKPLVENNYQLFDLRRQILAIIKGTPGLEDFETWTTFACLAPPPKEMEYQDSLVVENAMALESDNLDQQLDKAFQTLINNLAKPGIAGIPVGGNESGEYRLHPALGKTLLSVYKASIHPVLVLISTNINHTENQVGPSRLQGYSLEATRS